MTARDLIQEVLMATTDKAIKECVKDPLDTKIMINGAPLRDYVEVQMCSGRPVIVLFEDEGD